MFIRTQDKMAIIDIRNMICKINVCKNECEIICYNTTCIADDGYEVLGFYSTKEKAIKVLDKIEEKYKKYSTINTAFNDERKYLIKELKDNFVFQMPEDIEVKV